MIKQAMEQEEKQKTKKKSSSRTLDKTRYRTMNSSAAVNRVMQPEQSIEESLVSNQLMFQNKLEKYQNLMSGKQQRALNKLADR